MEHARRPLQKITFGALREYGVRGVLIYCADYRCSRLTAISAMGADDLRLSDIEDPFTSTACGKRGADVRPELQLGREARREGGLPVTPLGPDIVAPDPMQI